MKRIRMFFLFAAATGALGTAVACSGSSSDGASVTNPVTVDEELVIPNQADLAYDVTSGVSGQRARIGVDRVSIRGRGERRTVSIREERAMGTSTALVSATSKGHVDYGASANPRFTFDLLSVPAAQQSSWTPVAGPIINGTLAAEANRTGVFPTVNVHQLRVVDRFDSERGRIYRVLVDSRRRVVEDADEPRADGVTNATWGYRNVVVGRGVADLFVRRGTAEAVLVRAAEYRMLGEDGASSDSASIDALRALVTEGDAYLTLRCLRDAGPDVRSAFAAAPRTGLDIDTCGL